ncbi:XRE family transcriptional regulator [Lachnoclostridium sp. An298]|nr:XRE family transcriptional regulator [Lachnoclostridium sp. An298]
MVSLKYTLTHSLFGYPKYHMNRSQLNRLRHDQNVEVNTIDKLCNILNCWVEDIMTHFPDDNVF